MARQLPVSPKATSVSVSKVMKANKAKGTQPELAIRHELWISGVRGYRVNWKGAPGRPDICFTKKKVAVLINGCFWHRCPICNTPYPKTNTDFWRKKFELNIARDRTKLEALQASGWYTLVLWECEIKKNLQAQVMRVSCLLDQIKV